MSLAVQGGPVIDVFWFVFKWWKVISNQACFTQQKPGLVERLGADRSPKFVLKGFAGNVFCSCLGGRDRGTGRWQWMATKAQKPIKCWDSKTKPHVLGSQWGVGDLKPPFLMKLHEAGSFVTTCRRDFDGLKFQSVLSLVLWGSTAAGRVSEIRAYWWAHTPEPAAPTLGQQPPKTYVLLWLQLLYL